MDKYKKKYIDITFENPPVAQKDKNKVESHYNSSDTRCRWRGLQTVTDYTRPSRATHTGASLPDELNIFYACFEGNDPQPATRTLVALDDCMLWISVADISTAFKRA